MPNSNDLWIGKKHTGKITLFHGLSNYDESAVTAVRKAIRIINHHSLSPFDIRAKDQYSRLRQAVFQLYISSLTKEFYRDSIANGAVDLYDFAYGNQQLLKQHLRIVDKFDINSIDLGFKIHETSESGRSLTNWFSQQLSGYYGQHVSFKFALTASQVADLDLLNAGGTAFYLKGRGKTAHVVSHQELPLSYCTEIVVSPEVFEGEGLKLIQGCLAEHGLSHIKITNHQNKFRSDYLKSLLSTNDFDPILFYKNLSENVSKKIEDKFTDIDIFENPEYTAETQDSKYGCVRYIKLGSYIHIIPDLTIEEQEQLFNAIKSSAKTFAVRAAVERLERRCLDRVSDSFVCKPILAITYSGMTPPDCTDSEQRGQRCSTSLQMPALL
jgi:hypothetical protein